MKHNRNKRIVKQKIPERNLNADWSNYQLDVFNEVELSNNHLVVLAAPGSGKTTTIVESLYHIPEEESVICLAFNSSTEENLMLKIPSGRRAKTFHKLGLEAIRRYWGEKYSLKGRTGIDADDTASLQLAERFIGNSDSYLKVRENIVQAVKMSKTMLANTPENIENVCKTFGISSRGIDNKEFVSAVYNMLETMKREPLKLNGHHVVSFDDMLWLPNVNNWETEKFDRVFVDEAQDLSASRISLTLKAMKTGGKICAVADKMQAIYSFAGVDTDVIDMFINDMNAKIMPLSVSYRCPKKIVELAATINPDIKSAPSAIDGTINHCSLDNLYKNLVPGKSAVLSRTNYALVSCAFNLLKNGIRTTIIGKDIGERFIWRINNWAPNSVQDLQKSILMWQTEMCENNSPANCNRIIDEAKSILKFTQNVSTIDETKNLIRKFFSDSGSDHVKLSTAHKAKGLEWENVFLLEKTFRHNKIQDDKPNQMQEEKNIFYVAATRSQKTLTFVN